MPSPEPPEDSDSTISGPLVSVFAASASVRAGTRTAADTPGVSGRQANSRTASRYRSVAARVIRSSSISSRTPVSIGRVSSRPAATATWLTASAKTSLSTMPADDGIDGSDG